jgi:hypothetical protein
VCGGGWPINWVGSVLLFLEEGHVLLEVPWDIKVVQVWGLSDLGVLIP